MIFDVWFSEQGLYKNGQYDKVMSLLRQGGYISEKEDATWFVSTALGDDKDNVVVRSDGSPTYFASDIASFSGRDRNLSPSSAIISFARSII